jgi:hypothetical protein
MSVFVMGVYDEKGGGEGREERGEEEKKGERRREERRRREKGEELNLQVGNGFSDKEIDRLQTAFKVLKIEKDPSRCPDWLDCTKTLVPDFVVKNPTKYVFPPPPCSGVPEFRSFFFLLCPNGLHGNFMNSLHM